MGKKRTILTVALPDPTLLERLSERAWRERTTMSAIIREMIEEYLKRNPRKPTVGKSRKRQA